MTENKNVFYGWIILIACIFLMGLGYAPLVSCASLFISPVTEDLGFARGAYTITTSIASLMMAFMSPVIGKLMAGKNMRKTIVVCTILNCLVYLFYSMSSQLWQFYLTAMLVGITECGCTMVPVSCLITNWFKKKHGLVMSIALAGSGLGGTILSPIIGTLISDIGWRGAFRTVGLIRLVILVPIVILLVKARPADMGLKRYGEDEGTAAAAAAAKPAREWNPTLKELKGTKVFWTYIVGIVLVTCTGAMITQIPSAITDAGYSITTASFIASLYLAIAIPGKLILGAVYDRYGTRAGLLFGNTLFFLSAVTLIFIGNQTMLYVMAVLFGFGTCIGTVTGPVITKNFFGVKHYSEIYGFTTMCTTIGYAVTVPILASIHDLTNSYNAAWILIAVLTLIMTLLLLSSQKSVTGKTEEQSN